MAISDRVENRLHQRWYLPVILKHSLKAVALLSLFVLAGCGAEDSNQGTVEGPVATITVQPNDQSVVAGNTATFTIVASNATSYQWQLSTDNGATFANISGATASSYTTPVMTLADNGTKYRCEVRGAQNSVLSSAVTLTITVGVVAPSIVVPPANQTVLEGQPASFSVTAAGTLPSYQWQVSTNGGATWSNIPGATTSSYTTPATTTANTGTRYRAVASNSAGTATSNAATLTVNAAPVTPAFSTQPANQTVTAPNPATFTVVANGTPTPALQWQISTDGGTTWSNIPGATTSSYTTPATTTANTGTRYRAVASNSAGTATSNAATLTVNAAPVTPAFSTQPANQTVTAPNPATFTVVANGTPTPALQWQISTDGGASWSNITGETTSSYTTPATTTANTGTRYRAVASNSAGTATSNAATLTVNAAPVTPAFSTQPANQTVTAPNPATFTVAANGTPTPTLQWQISTDGGTTWSNIPGATTSSYTTPATTTANTGTRYRAVASNSAGTATSNAATLTVQISFSDTIQPLFTNTCAISGCHNGTVNPNLTTGTSRTNIVNIQSGQCAALKLVTPGDPSQSWLMMKVDVTIAKPLTCASFTSSMASFLNATDRTNLQNWILEGAQGN